MSDEELIAQQSEQSVSEPDVQPVMSKIAVGDTEIDGGSDIQLPASRLFRDHWVLNGDVIEVDINSAKESAHTVRRLWRTTKETSFFIFNGSPFSASKESIDRIQGAVQMAQIQESDGPGSFSIIWFDNNDVPHHLGFEGLKSLFLALANHVQTVFTDNLLKKGLIDSTGSAQELEEIIGIMEVEIAGFAH